MFSRLQLAKKYRHYIFNASNGKGHGIHSPFVFDFVKNVLNDNGHYDAYQKVESLRSEMLHNDTVIEVQDLGAGSTITNSRQRKVSDIARHAAKPKKFAQLLFRIVRHYQPKSILELGTSLGVSTSYLALANPASRVITLEGATAVANIAVKNFTKLSLNHIQLREGNFDDTLQETLSGFDVIDLAFIDGNHRKEPTVQYFSMLSKRINSSSIIIFDDIHWSSDMEEAWETIKANEAVTLSIDLFFIGIVFFRADFKTKQHFVISF